MYCTGCGHKLSDTDKFCPECGQKVEWQNVSTNNQAESRQNQTINQVPDLSGIDWSPSLSDNDSQKSDRPFYFSTWFIVLMLLLLPPVGIVLMWIGKRFNVVVRIILSVVFVFIFIIQIVSFTSPKKQSNNANETQVETETSAEPLIEKAETKAETASKETTMETIEETAAAEIEIPGIELTERANYVPGNGTDMKIGDVVQVGDFYVGLSYVKKTGSVSMSMGSKEEVDAGSEVIIPFFEVYNHSATTSDFNKGNISAYGDSETLSDVDFSFYICEDGIEEYSSYDLDPGTQAIAIQDFQIKKGWKDLVIYYKDCYWRLTPEDVSSEPFNKEPLFVRQEVGYTVEGSPVYSDEFELTFDGLGSVPAEYSWSGPWIVFKYTMKNNSDETLDLGLVGYKMRGYQDNYLLNDASYSVDTNLDGYVNIYDVDEIKPGMSAKVYVAFEAEPKDSDMSMAFDMGYIFSDKKAFISAHFDGE